MQYTDNYQFREPTPAVDIVKIGDINYNSRKIDELIHSTQVSLAPAYDETRTSSNPYMTGDVVMKDALMYRCLDDDVYGAWDATKWERTTASESGEGGSAELDILGEASGAVASFADGASAGLAKCIAEIVPKQDLHGYDKPWAGGAGKNIFGYEESTTDETATYRSNINQRLIISKVTENEIKCNYNNGNYSEGYLVINGVDGTLTYSVSYTIKKKTVTYNPDIIKDTVNSDSTKLVLKVRGNNGGNVAANTEYVTFTNIQVESGSTATTYEPYSNICPISGYTAVNVNVTGKNLAPRIVGSAKGITCSLNKDGSISATGQASATANIAVVFTVHETGTYTLSGCPSGGGASSYQIWIYDVTDLISTTLIDTGSNSTGQLQAGHTYSIRIRYASGVTANETFYPQLEKGTIATEFEPYKRSAITTPLGQTVYGGQLNVLTGVLTIDKAIITLDGSESWNDNSTINGFTLYNKLYVTSSRAEGISDRFKIITEYDSTEIGLILGLANKHIYASHITDNLSGISSVSDWKAWLSTNNVNIVCEITPQTVQLTPQEVNSLLGQNNISADTGDIDIVYVKASAPIQPNPTGTPTATLKKLGIEGTVFELEGGGGGGNVYGAFIDVNRVIQETITVQGSTPIEYTATEDCCVIYTVTESGSSQSMVYVNDTMIKLNVGKTDVNWLYLKSGDELRITGSSAKNYTVFGLTFGTQNIFTPIIYSTEERCVGVWIDNKPLYAKSYDFGALPNNTAKTLSSGLTGVNVVKIDGIATNASGFTTTIPHPETGGNGDVQIDFLSTKEIRIKTNSDYSAFTGYVTLYYTKTTDTAGSGAYNTLGVPMVHESTTEQVIGTDENGNTKYEITLTTPTSQSGNSYFFDLTGVDDVEIVGGYIDIGTADIPLNFNIGSFNNSTYTFYDKQNSQIISYIVGWTPSYFKIKIQYTKSSS